MKKVKANFVKKEEHDGKGYWPWMQTHGRHNEAGELAESSRANPNVLSDEVLAPWEITEAQREVQGRVEKLVGLAKQILSEQQYKVFVLCEYNDPALTEREAAEKLGISAPRVHQLLVKANEKLQKAYEERT